MEISEENSRRIQEIMDSMQCPKGFKCAANAFEILCKAEDLGDPHSLHCLEEASPSCPFVSILDYGFQMRFCRCPLRMYLGKNIAK